MNQPSLFDTEHEAEPTDLDAAIQEITDALDKWQVLLTPEDWATVVATVTVFFRLTTMEAKDSEDSP